MAYPVLTIITDALQDLGAIAIGESLTADEAASGLRALNNLIETWNNESLMVYNVVEEIFDYIPGQADYTIGTGGDFNTTRPITIEAAYNRQSSGTSNELDIPLYVTNNAQEYADLLTKRIESTLPTVLYDNGGFPLKTLTFWPIPSDTSYRPVLWSWQQISGFDTVDDDVSLPPGYKRALQKNLAIEVAPAYGREPTPSLERQAIQSKGWLKRTNYTINAMVMPTGIPGTSAPPGLPQFKSGYP